LVSPSAILLDDCQFGYITKSLKETLVGGFCYTQLRLVFCNTEITGSPFFSVFREGPHTLWKIHSKLEETTPFCKAPSQKAEEAQEGSYLSVRWLLKKLMVPPES
jgi:hypothetical protein